MKKSMFVWISVILAVFILAMPADAIGVKKNGTMQGAVTDIDFNGDNNGTYDGSTYTVNMGTLSGIYVAASTISPISKIEVVSDTPDTLTSAKSGYVFIATSSAAGGRKFDLPEITGTGDDGLTYTFIGGESSLNRTQNRTLTIHAQDGDSIFYTGKGTAGASLQALPNDTGSDSYPSIKVVSYGGNWFVVEAKGTWTTGS